jgi:hypothetical protein
MIVQLPNGQNSARVSFKTVRRKQSYARRLALSINGFAVLRHTPVPGKGIQVGVQTRFLCGPLWLFSVFSVLGFSEFNTKIKWWRGGELNSLRRPFQGRALPVSYPARWAVKDFTGALQGCQCSRGWSLDVGSWNLEVGGLTQMVDLAHDFKTMTFGVQHLNSSL